MKCPKCNGEMEKGFINKGLGVWKGDINDKPRIQEPLNPTIVYVCIKCGYMEFYRK